MIFFAFIWFLKNSTVLGSDGGERSTNFRFGGESGYSEANLDIRKVGRIIRIFQDRVNRTAVDI